jgi:hypothetical protein
VGWPESSSSRAWSYLSDNGVSDGVMWCRATVLTSDEERQKVVPKKQDAAALVYMFKCWLPVTEG